MIMLKTSEFVSPGHPDKFMDTLAETIVANSLKYNPKAHLGIEGVIKDNHIILAGEVSGLPEEFINHHITDWLNEVLSETGYTRDPMYTQEYTIDTKMIQSQSSDIKRGVDQSSTGAGDQGMCISGAIREAPDFTSWPFYLAKLLCYKLFYSRDESLYYPDIKTQITVDYSKSIPEVVAVTASIATESQSIKDFVSSTFTDMMEPLEDKIKISPNCVYYLNPTGAFAQHFSYADAGVVGRKIVVDQLGGEFPVGGGCLNGKDPSKVDRTGTYYARNLAKQILSDNPDYKRVEVTTSWNIGVSTSNHVQVLADRQFIDLPSYQIKTVDEIIKAFDLDKDFDHIPYLGMWGHLGSNPLHSFKWEHLNIFK